MTAILVRVGIDATYGHWNAPADPRTGEFVYVPIPEASLVHPKHGIEYASVLQALKTFCQARDIDVSRDLRFPPQLLDQPMHLDPDFDFLTYGDNASRRGSQIAVMQPGDVLVFYAGLRSVVDATLVYGIVGTLTVAEIVFAPDVPQNRFGENAHTRRLNPRPTEFVVRGVPGRSGRLSRYLPIGDRRDGAYRVRRDLLETWGGLSVKDGFIQRSARPPRFTDPQRFLAWLDRQGVTPIARNN